MADRYEYFGHLDQYEERGTDYEIRVIDRGSKVAIIAPHGGWIEPGSSDVAAAIAGDHFSYYSFEGVRKGRAHSDLHITSTRFDEPHALHLLQSAETAIAVHGRADGTDCAIWIGGRNAELGASIIAALNRARFLARRCGGRLGGTDPGNVCNRGTSGAGVQLELPRTLRANLAQDEELMESFATTVRRAATDWLAI